MFLIYSIAWRPSKIEIFIGIAATATAIKTSGTHSQKSSNYSESKENPSKENKNKAKDMRMLKVYNQGVAAFTVLTRALIIISQYNLPSNLENINKVKERIEQDYKEVEKYRIIYCKDKYLWVRLQR